jgi:hypothetical protein
LRFSDEIMVERYAHMLAELCRTTSRCN